MVIPCIFIGKTDEKKLKKNSGEFVKSASKSQE
jgi:hypothetical protein